MRDDLGACALGESSERLRDRTDRPSEPGTTWLAGCRDRNWSELSRSLRGTFWTTMRLAILEALQVAGMGDADFNSVFGLVAEWSDSELAGARDSAFPPLY